MRVLLIFRESPFFNESTGLRVIAFLSASSHHRTHRAPTALHRRTIQHRRTLEHGRLSPRHAPAQWRSHGPESAICASGTTVGTHGRHECGVHHGTNLDRACGRCIWHAMGGVIGRRCHKSHARHQCEQPRQRSPSDVHNPTNCGVTRVFLSAGISCVWVNPSSPK